MELAAQQEAKGLWLDLKWTPREQNVHADALTNGKWERFNASLRVASHFSEIDFLVLPTLLKAGAELAHQAAALRAEGPRHSERRTRRDQRLSATDPW